MTQGICMFPPLSFFFLSQPLIHGFFAIFSVEFAEHELRLLSHTINRFSCPHSLLKAHLPLPPQFYVMLVMTGTILFTTTGTCKVQIIQMITDFSSPLLRVGLLLAFVLANPKLKMGVVMA